MGKTLNIPMPGFIAIHPEYSFCIYPDMVAARMPFFSFKVKSEAILQCLHKGEFLRHLQVLFPFVERPLHR
jgi:hypothetical protein